MAAADGSAAAVAKWLQTIHGASDLAPYMATADDGTARATWSNPPMSSKAKTVSDLMGRKGAGRGGTVAVTAPTGIAAVNVGGVTIHSFAGIGLGHGETEAIIGRVKRNQKACEKWSNAAALVIDEVSMLSAQLFELLDAIARAVRCKPSVPFGGLQLILCGDFCQLPPVALSIDSGGSGFCFQSPAWAAAGLDKGTIVLQEAHRQASDPKFVQLLNEVRRGCCSDETVAALRDCVVGVKPQPTDGILATRLYCTNRDVDAENNARLAALKGGMCVFNAEDSFDDSISEWQREKLRDIMDKKVVGKLTLKIGAQVVLVRNLSKTLANGSRGVVVGMQAMLRVRVKFDGGEEESIEPTTFSQNAGGAGCMSRTQLPLKLGWALTVHRAQGMTLSRAELDLDGAFECGQSYVALSRVTSLAGLWMRTELRPEQVSANRDVLVYYKSRAASGGVNAASAAHVAVSATNGGAGSDGGAVHLVTITDKGPLGIILTQKAGRVLLSSITAGGRAASSEGGNGMRKGMALVKAGDVHVKPPAMLWQSKLARLPRPLVLTFVDVDM
jgi:ATP-dependent DNA helicase PIF1